MTWEDLEWDWIFCQACEFWQNSADRGMWEEYLVTETKLSLYKFIFHISTSFILQHLRSFMFLYSLFHSSLCCKSRCSFFLSVSVPSPLLSTLEQWINTESWGSCVWTVVDCFSWQESANRKKGMDHTLTGSTHAASYSTSDDTHTLSFPFHVVQFSSVHMCIFFSFKQDSSLIPQYLFSCCLHLFCHFCCLSFVLFFYFL